MLNNQNSWSDWLDSNDENISNIPRSSGVFMMHSSMKILCIEGTKNINNSIREKITQPCILENTRLRYMITDNFEKISSELIQDYKNRHEGNLPLCMQE
ncbi:hypothetical protein NsoK4_02850 [Nitrosopumilus sp. K4]|nr:hypothetical protein NsoK4_02850 [Nitrosopumilus sp. K4]